MSAWWNPLLALLLAACGGDQVPPGQGLNVLLITLDTVRGDHLSLGGETSNVIAQHPGVVSRLLNDLIEREPWVTRPFPEEGGGAEFVADALGALGYGGGDGDGGSATGPQWRYICRTHPKLRELEPGPCTRCAKSMFPIADG